jgi:hypothetical protein
VNSLILFWNLDWAVSSNQWDTVEDVDEKEDYVPDESVKGGVKDHYSPNNETDACAHDNHSEKKEVETEIRYYVESLTHLKEKMIRWKEFGSIDFPNHF